MTYTTNTTTRAHGAVTAVVNVAITVIVAAVIFAFQSGAAQILERMAR